MKTKKFLRVVAILALLVALLPAVSVQAGNGKGNDSHGSGNGSTIQGDSHPGKGVQGNHGKKLNATLHGLNNETGAEKVNVCHRKGNGDFILINVSVNALPAHIAHGDAQPEVFDPENPETIVDENCEAIEVTRIDSTPMSFGPMGWGGWSCPTGTMVVGGGYEPATAVVTYSGPAKPGVTTTTEPQYTYPVYPHYTFTPPETGWVVQNSNLGQSLTVYVLCAPVTPGP